MIRADAAASASLGSLEDRIEDLGRAGGGLRRVLAALARRLAERRDYEALGYARLGDYARERLGTSARQLQELARVDRALGSLPRLEAALVTGGLPWSKVRLVARFASPETEAALIGLTRRASVRQLERDLRTVARTAAGEPVLDEEGNHLEPRETLLLRMPLRLGFKWHRTRTYAARVAGEALPGEAVLEHVTAEVLAGLPRDVIEARMNRSSISDDLVRIVSGPGVVVSAAAVETRESATDANAGSGTHMVAGSGDSPPALDAGAGEAPGSALASDDDEVALPPFLRPLLTGLATADAFELDARLRRAVRIEQRRDAELARLLRRVASRDHAWRGPERSLAAFVRERLGMSPRKARALLRLERVGDAYPALRRAFRDGSLSWVQAQLVARLVGRGEATQRHLARWVEFAPTVSVRRLEEAVSTAELCDEPVGPEVAIEQLSVERPGSAGERQTCAHPTALETTDAGEMRIGLRVSAPSEVIGLFQQTLAAVRLAAERATGRLPTAWEGFEAMLDHALRAWEVADPWLRARSKRENAIFERDGWRCTVPGCTSQRNLQRHHIVFRSAGGNDEAGNQTTLCAFHHLRGVHAGRVRIAGEAPHGLVFELGARTDRAPLVRYASGDRVVA